MKYNIEYYQERPLVSLLYRGVKPLFEQGKIKINLTDCDVELKNYLIGFLYQNMNIFNYSTDNNGETIWLYINGLNDEFTSYKGLIDDSSKVIINGLISKRNIEIKDLKQCHINDLSTDSHRYYNRLVFLLNRILTTRKFIGAYGRIHIKTVQYMLSLNEQINTKTEESINKFITTKQLLMNGIFTSFNKGNYIANLTDLDEELRGYLIGYINDCMVLECEYDTSNHTLIIHGTNDELSTQTLLNTDLGCAFILMGLRNIVGCNYGGLTPLPDFMVKRNSQKFYNRLVKLLDKPYNKNFELNEEYIIDKILK